MQYPGTFAPNIYALRYLHLFVTLSIVIILSWSAATWNPVESIKAE